MTLPYNDKVKELQRAIGVAADGLVSIKELPDGSTELGETLQRCYDLHVHEAPPASGITGPNGKPIVIDIYHGDWPLDLNKLKAAGVVGLIAKCTSGTHTVDSRWLDTVAWCAHNGMPLTGYHWSTGESPPDQAAFLIRNLNGLPGMLDWEKNEMNGHPLPGGDMTTEQAAEFIVAYHDIKLINPLLYMGGYGKDCMNGQSNKILNACDLMLAQYGSHAVLPPGFERMKLWQFTDRFSIPGVSHGLDASELFLP